MFKTSYSFRYAIGRPEDVVARLKSFGYKSAPIADVSSVYGLHKWKRACEAEGLKPIFGAAIHVTPMLEAKNPATDIFTFLAIDSVRPINEIVTEASRHSTFVYEVQSVVGLLKYDYVMALDNVIKIAGHTARLELLEPQENLYIGLSPACSKGFIRQAKERGFKFIAMQNNRYPSPEDYGQWQIVVGKGADTKLYPQYIMSDDEWLSHIDDKELALEAIQNRNDVFDKCNATIPRAGVYHVNAEKSLRELCEEGAQKLGVDLTDPVYAERFELELKTIHEKGFDDYFHIVSDMMQYARSEMLCGPGRGSSAGSLVVYLLGITAIDPIKWGLLFFRFIDPSRPDMADIDSDFPYSRRQDIIAYLADKYGHDKVAKVGTFANLKSDSILNEVSKSLGIPRFEFDSLKVEKYAANDDRNDDAVFEALNNTPQGARLIEKYPALATIGTIGGMPRHASTHASGVLVTDRSLTEYVAVDVKTETAQIDKDDAEKNGLLKIDVLALKTLDAFMHTLALANLPADYLDKIPLDDRAAFDVVNNGKFTGLFQYDGAAVRGICSQIKIESIEDIATVSTLARPGALDSGGAALWVKRRNGLLPVEYPHPLLEPYLRDTLGILTYQEQIMMIAREVADMDWKLVAGLRKAIAKSMGDEAIAKFGKPFVDGLKNKGIDESIAEDFFKSILTFGKYSFNRSHAIAYALMSYYSFYLKAHHVMEFAAGLLSYQDNVDKQLAILKELASEGISYVPFDAEASTDKWNVSEGRLVGPLQNIIGLGPKNVNIILSCRARNEPLPTKILKKLQNAKTKLDSLTPVADRIAKIDMTKHIVGSLTPLSEIVPNGTWQENVYVCGEVLSVEESDENSERKIADRLSRGQTGLLPGNPKSIMIRIRDDGCEKFNMKISAKDYGQMAPKVLGIKEGSLVVARITVMPDFVLGLVKKVKEIEE